VVLTAYIIRTIVALMMKAVSTSETTVNLYQTTRRNIPEDSRHLHIRRRENLKCHETVVADEVNLLVFNKTVHKFLDTPRVPT
jgi:hypothetical protein